MSGRRSSSAASRGSGRPARACGRTTSCSSGRRPRSTTSAAAAFGRRHRAGRCLRSSRHGSPASRSSRSTPGRGCRPCSSTACSLRRSSRSGIPFERWLPRPIVRRMFNGGVANFSVYTDGFNRAAARLGRRRPPQLRVAPARRPHARHRRPGAARRRGVRYGGVAPQRPLPARDTHPLCRPDLRPPAHPSARARRAVPRRAGSDRRTSRSRRRGRRRARSGRRPFAATACGSSSRGLSTT